MARLETVVHTTRNTREADRLREALATAGIEARVLQTAEVDPTAPPSELQVLVAQQDALVARQVAGEFLANVSAAPSEPDEGPPGAGSLPEWWPKCPGCGASRSASCPVCGTSGTRFQPIDMGFSLIEGLDDLAAGPGASCGPAGCGPGGCTPPGEAAVSNPPPDDADRDPTEGESGEVEEEAGADMADRMVICPTCDEPFRPEHLKLCEWCGHEFPDGIEVRPGEAETDYDEFTGRVYIVIALLAAVAIGAVVYFGFVVY